MAREEDDGMWEVPIRGWIFEHDRKEKRRGAFIALLRASLHLEGEDREILKRRATPFLVDNKRRKTIRVRIGDEIYRLPRSAKNGHFEGVFRIPLNDSTVQKGTLPFEAVLNPRDKRHFGSMVHLLSESGLSVISDIDDTVKVTNVADKRSLLRNTFLKEFQPVPGMAELYREWETERGCRFHFVSSSPWQLYQELDAFRSNEGFPGATFHLKSVRIKDKSLFNLFADPVKTKTAMITSILDKFPHRRYICVGDSGEKDPEVYGALARQYPDQIKYILIRNVTAGDAEDDRMKKAFASLPSNKWTVFSDASQIQLPTDC